MKAVVYHEYGNADVLKLEEVPKPVPGDNDVLIQIKIASVNSYDWDLMRGEPKIFRLLFGIGKPKFPIIGSDACGIVEEVGSEVKSFKKGDEVLVDLSPVGFGCFAEYACGHEKYFASRPEGLTDEDAGALPQAGVLAYQGLLKMGDVKSGEKILISGAGGGVGLYAIQMAGNMGLEVTAVDRASKLQTMKDMGASRVIDFESEDFSDLNEKFNYVLDNWAVRPLDDYNASMADGGRYVMIGGEIRRILQMLTKAQWLNWTTSKNFSILGHRPNRLDLTKVAKMVASGEVKSMIHQTYPLENTADAVQALGDGKVIGKVVVRI